MYVYTQKCIHEFDESQLQASQGHVAQEPRALGKQIKSLLPQEAMLKQHKLQAAKVPGTGHTRHTLKLNIESHRKS